MPVEVIRTITSVGSLIDGSGTVSTRTSRLPCQVNARMSGLPAQLALQLLHHSVGALHLPDAAQRLDELAVRAVVLRELGELVALHRVVGALEGLLDFGHLEAHKQGRTLDRQDDASWARPRSDSPVADPSARDGQAAPRT